MILSEKESSLFYKLIFGIQFYILRSSEVNSQIKSIKEYIRLPLKAKMKYRDMLWGNNEWIGKYICNNRNKLDENEIEIIKKWKNPIIDKFVVERILKKYSIFISSSSRVYGVLGITDEIDKIVNRNQLPAYIETVILPFNNKIIYDGLLIRHAVSFGKGMRNSFKSTYNQAKVNNQIITYL